MPLNENYKTKSAFSKQSAAKEKTLPITYKPLQKKMTLEEMVAVKQERAPTSNQRKTELKLYKYC